MTASPQVLIAGATGLVGSRCVAGWLALPRWRGRLLAPVRRAPDVEDRRLATLVAPLADAEDDEATRGSLRDALAGVPLDAFVSCLGTTLRRAGSREAFVAVDRDLVVRLARIAREFGARQAILVSSAGASRQSGNFYLRVKGETEDALASLGFERLDVLRPGLLLGTRDERRPAEALGQHLAPWINPFLHGRLARYRAVPADAVAATIRHLVGAGAPGRFVHEGEALGRTAD